ncbi:MAG: hypothetical protein H7Z72_06695 [Bacteroidetes bacterium]|nr:hypothetical protein [Fibrella sp.]
MTDPDDYEYSGRRSRFPPVWPLVGYFGFGSGVIWLGFDRLTEFTRFENAAATGRLQPMIRVQWLEKAVYELGGKYLVFGLTIAFGAVLIACGITRLRSWLRLRNGH